MNGVGTSRTDRLLLPRDHERFHIFSGVFLTTDTTRAVPII